MGWEGYIPLTHVSVLSIVNQKTGKTQLGFLLKRYKIWDQKPSFEPSHYCLLKRCLQWHKRNQGEPLQKPREESGSRKKKRKVELDAPEMSCKMKLKNYSLELAKWKSLGLPQEQSLLCRWVRKQPGVPGRVNEN